MLTLVTSQQAGENATLRPLGLAEEYIALCEGLVRDSPRQEGPAAAAAEAPAGGIRVDPCCTVWANLQEGLRDIHLEYGKR